MTDKAMEAAAQAIFQSDIDHGICNKTWAEETEADKALYRLDAQACITAWLAEPDEDRVKRVRRVIARTIATDPEHLKYENGDPSFDSSATGRAVLKVLQTE